MQFSIELINNLIIAQSTVQSFTSFVESEFKYFLYGVLVVMLIVTIIKRAFIWSLGVIVAFGVFAFFGNNPMELVNIAKDIARVMTPRN